MPKKARVLSRELKLAAVRRMLAGENVSALARELKVLRKDLYKWREKRGQSRLIPPPAASSSPPLTELRHGAPWPLFPA